MENTRQLERKINESVTQTSNHNENHAQLPFYRLNNDLVFSWLLHMSMVSAGVFLAPQSAHSSHTFAVPINNKDVENASWLCQNQFIIFNLAIVSIILPSDSCG